MLETLILLEELEEGGWRLEVEDDKVIVRGKPLDQALRERIKESKWLIIKYYREAKTSKIPDIFLPDIKPKICYPCGGSLFWISKHNVRLYCVTCHPPASEEIVAGWVGRKNEKIELKEIFKKQDQVNYQKSICKWCLSGKYLNCPDCERRRDGKEKQG
ncbi:MAG: hypothetical protein ACP5RW_08210 [bacterium]